VSIFLDLSAIVQTSLLYVLRFLPSSRNKIEAPHRPTGQPKSKEAFLLTQTRQRKVLPLQMQARTNPRLSQLPPLIKSELPQSNPIKFAHSLLCFERYVDIDSHTQLSDTILIQLFSPTNELYPSLYAINPYGTLSNIITFQHLLRGQRSHCTSISA